MVSPSLFRSVRRIGLWFYLAGVLAVFFVPLAGELPRLLVVVSRPMTGWAGLQSLGWALAGLALAWPLAWWVRRALGPARADPAHGEIPPLFLAAATAVLSQGGGGVALVLALATYLVGPLGRSLAGPCPSAALRGAIAAGCLALALGQVSLFAPLADRAGWGPTLAGNLTSAPIADTGGKALLLAMLCLLLGWAASSRKASDEGWSPQPTSGKRAQRAWGSILMWTVLALVLLLGSITITLVSERLPEGPEGVDITRLDRQALVRLALQRLSRAELAAFLREHYAEAFRSRGMDISAPVEDAVPVLLAEFATADQLRDYLRLRLLRPRVEAAIPLWKVAGSWGPEEGWGPVCQETVRPLGRYCRVETVFWVAPPRWLNPVPEWGRDLLVSLLLAATVAVAATAVALPLAVQWGFALRRGRWQRALGQVWALASLLPPAVLGLSAAAWAIWLGWGGHLVFGTALFLALLPRQVLALTDWLGECSPAWRLTALSLGPTPFRAMLGLGLALRRRALVAVSLRAMAWALAEAAAPLLALRVLDVRTSPPLATQALELALDPSPSNLPRLSALALMLLLSWGALRALAQTLDRGRSAP